MLLNRIKTLLQIQDNDELIYEIIEITKEKILNYINEKELPKELEFILIELAVERYNRIGSEGIASESVDGKNVSYEDNFSTSVWPPKPSDISSSTYNPINLSKRITVA